MLRIIAGTVLGGIAFFVWGALAWMVLQLHADTLRTLDNEQPVMQALAAHVAEPGVYVFPGWPEGFQEASREEQQAMMEELGERQAQGPIGVLSIHPDGKESMAPMTFVTGFGLNLAMALLGSLLLAAASLRWYIARVMFMAGIGLAVGVSSHMINWNWLHYSLDYSVMQVVDTVIGWSLAGVVIGMVVRPHKAAKADNGD